MTNKQTTPSRVSVQREESYPLISIVQLVTFCVALVTCVDFKKFAAVLESTPANRPGNLVIAVVAASLPGFVIGSAIGLGQIRKWRSLLLCGGVGAVVSMLMLATYVAPAMPAQALAAIMLPLVTTLILRSRTP